MSWWTSYDDLNLDEISQITDADNNRAPEMEEQAAAVRELTSMVQASLDRVLAARKRITQKDLQTVSRALMLAGSSVGTSPTGLGAGLGMVFEGLSARAAVDRTSALGDKTGNAADRLGKHEPTFTEVAALARKTHARMTMLREQRDGQLDRLRANPSDPELRAEYGGGWIGDDPAAMEKSIRDRFDEDARSHMRSSAEAYLDYAGSLEPVEPYDGPRSSGSASSSIGGDGGPGGSVSSSHSASGPSLTRVPDSGEVAGAPELSGAPTLQTGPGLAAAPVPAVAGPPSVPASGFLAPPGGYFVPPVVVTAPVIGGRPTPGAVGASRTPPLRPNATGFTRPVFGERAGKAFNSFGQRQPQPVVRPGSGMRPATLPGQAGRGVRPGQTAGRANSRPGPAGVRPTAGSGAAVAKPVNPGVRGVPAATHTAEGKVIRGGVGERRVERARFSRQPKVTHGGSEELNRPVIRNSRVPSTPEPKPEAARESQAVREPDDAELWSSGHATVVAPVIRPKPRRGDGFDYDPGFFLTPHNFGGR